VCSIDAKAAAVSLKVMAQGWLIGLAVWGCAHTMSDSANATRVRTTTDREVIRDCAFVAMTTAKDQIDLQRKASQLGANAALVPIQWYPEGPQGLQVGVHSYADALVFRCRSGR
jgi:hypothetical protein